MGFSFTSNYYILSDTTPPNGFADGLQAVWNFFWVGGWYMAPILLCSFVALAVVVFKFIDLRRESIVPSELASKLSRIEELVEAGSLGEMSRSLRGNDAVLTRICRHALLGSHSSKEDAERSTEAIAREEVSKLERGIPVLEVIFTIAPLLGLIGTVSGLVTIFGSFGSRAAGPEQAQAIAKGISEALNTTIAGLVVAIPSYVFQSLFTRRLEALALRMSTLTTGLINAAYRAPVENPQMTVPVIIKPQIPAPEKKTEKEKLQPKKAEKESEGDPVSA